MGRERLLCPLFPSVGFQMHQSISPHWERSSRPGLDVNFHWGNVPPHCFPKLETVLYRSHSWYCPSFPFGGHLTERMARGTWHVLKINTHMCKHMHKSINTCSHTPPIHLCTHMHVHKHTVMHTHHAYTCAHTPPIHLCTHIHTHMCRHLSTHRPVHTHALIVLHSRTLTLMYTSLFQCVHLVPSLSRP